uniref:Uncharacterized protein n=1 Tax=Anopheles minimus TaxID=112268 RepID=A0A182WP46_9DIPT
MCVCACKFVKRNN